MALAHITLLQLHITLFLTFDVSQCLRVGSVISDFIKGV